MKHRLAALFLAAALFCTLLAGCAPTPDVPGPNGGSSSSGSTNNGGNSESEDNNNTNSPKLQPSVAMTYNIHPSFEENSYRVSYVFTVAKPNKVYSTKVRFSMTLKDAAGITNTDYTFSPSVAPGDTVRFSYVKTYKGWRPTNVSTSRTSIDFTRPENLVRSTELTAAKPAKLPDSVGAYDNFSGTVSNNSNYPVKVKVSLILKKSGQIVSSDMYGNLSTLLLQVPAHGSASYAIMHYKDTPYDDYEIVATPWN